MERTSLSRTLRTSSSTITQDGEAMARSIAELPSALGDRGLRERVAAGPIAVFCDYDGTLTPIVSRPELAVLSETTRRVLERLAGLCVVGIISGRDLRDVLAMVRTDGVWLAGSHGFDIAGPGGVHHELPEARAYAAALAAGADALEDLVAAIPGAWVERKRFAIATHYRAVDARRVPEVDRAVAAVRESVEGLRVTGGKCIVELRPDVDWDKGRAVWWLLDRIGLGGDGCLPIYVGDDLTDEDAFVTLVGRGVGIVVGEEDRPTRAAYGLADPDEVRRFLTDLADLREAAER
jgi:alpha,alpha-trehalase